MRERLTELLVEELDAELRVGHLLVVVRDPRRLAFARHAHPVVVLHRNTEA